MAPNPPAPLNAAEFLPFAHALALSGRGVRFDETGRILELFDTERFLVVYSRSVQTFSRSLSLYGFARITGDPLLKRWFHPAFNAQHPQLHLCLRGESARPLTREEALASTWDYVIEELPSPPSPPAPIVLPPLSPPLSPPVESPSPPLSPSLCHSPPVIIIAAPFGSREGVSACAFRMGLDESPPPPPHPPGSLPSPALVGQCIPAFGFFDTTS